MLELLSYHMLLIKNVILQENIPFNYLRDYVLEFFPNIQYISS